MRALAVHLQLHPRLFAAAVIGILLALLLPEAWGPLLRMIVGWDVASTLYLVFATVMMARATSDGMRRRAALQDESGFTLLVLTAAAAAFSLCASTGLLSGFKDLPDAQKPVVLALVIFTIITSWFFLQLLFTLHYAHEFYGPAEEGEDTVERGGLQFPGAPEAPAYIDFAYYSFTIGMTAQTSDTAVVSSTMRALTLAHGVLTFFFNTVILALSINIAASLL